MQRLLWLLSILGLVALGLCLYYGWLVMSDRIGTFHNVTDLADLDGNGHLDVILHNVRNESEFTAFSVTTLWFNQGDGKFAAQRMEDEAGWASAAGDLDGDDDVDLAIFPGWDLALLVNQGGIQGGQLGEFRRQWQLRGPERDGQFGSVLLDDLNGDGWMDGIVAGCCGRTFTVNPDDDAPNVSWVWINPGASGGSLSASPSILSALDGLAVRAAALGDLDGDGDLDLFAAVLAPPQGRNTDPADRVIVNDGSGNFSDSGQRLGQTESTAVALGDLDGDGDLDSLVGTEDGVMVWINQGAGQGGQEGTFAASRQGFSGGRTSAVFLSDLDADGDLDVLVAGRRQAATWWNDGQAVFTRSGRRFHYSERHGLAVADFDGDGRPDIFAAAYSEDYRLWLNQGDRTFSSP